MAKGSGYCTVPGCGSKAHKKLNISFHRFPNQGENFVNIRNEFGKLEIVDRLQAWKTVLKMKDVNQFMKVCSLHFRNKDYFPQTAAAKARCLKKNAVPSCNLPGSPGKKINTNEQADQAQFQKQVVTKTSEKIKSSTNHCAYLNCFHTRYKNQQSRSFRFPTNKERRAAWIENCGNHTLFNLPDHLLSNRYICDRHFADESFKNSEKKSLNLNAVPIKYDIDKQIGTGRISYCTDDGSAHENDDDVSSDAVRSGLKDDLNVEDNSREKEETKNNFTDISIKCEAPEFTDALAECEDSKAGLETYKATVLDIKPEAVWLPEKIDFDLNSDLKIKREPLFDSFEDEKYIKQET